MSWTSVTGCGTAKEGVEVKSSRATVNKLGLIVDTEINNPTKSKMFGEKVEV